MRSSSCLIAGRENLSRYPVSPPLPSLSLLLRHPHLSLEMRPSVSPRPVLAKSRNLTGSSVPREILPSQFTLSLPQLATTSPTRPWAPSRASLFLHSLPFSYPLHSARNTFLKGSDLTRYETETSAGSQLWDYPADPFRLDAVLQIPFPTGCATYLSIGPTTFRSDDQKRLGNPTRPANMTCTVIFRREVVIFRASDTMKLFLVEFFFYVLLTAWKSSK